jgi:hypothetical protein
MKSPDDLEARAIPISSAVTQVRLEVAQALRQAVPNEALLKRALERVESLLGETKAELAALMQLVEPGRR